MEKKRSLGESSGTVGSRERITGLKGLARSFDPNTTDDVNSQENGPRHTEDQRDGRRGINPLVKGSGGGHDLLGGRRDGVHGPNVCLW